MDLATLYRQVLQFQQDRLDSSQQLDQDIERLEALIQQQEKSLLRIRDFASKYRLQIQNQLSATRKVMVDTWIDPEWADTKETLVDDFDRMWNTLPALDVGLDAHPDDVPAVAEVEPAADDNMAPTPTTGDHQSDEADDETTGLPPFSQQSSVEDTDMPGSDDEADHGLGSSIDFF
ncbi:hypothetical protein HDV03_002728 [Kappamyces sp. JEL0829]|nr:hypothetical protein HDV03_002728 [Kappamyces sp. JEL0829]